MPNPNQETQALKKKISLSSQEKQKRKERVLTQGTPSVTQSIADAVVIKNENLYFLTRPDGNVPLGGNHGFGLYYQDCRYLKGYELKVAKRDPNVLVSNADEGFVAVFELTNPEIHQEGDEHIGVNEIGIKSERMLDAGEHKLYDVISVQNYSRQHAEIPLSLTFQAGFEDVFAIRGLIQEHPGELHPPQWKNGALSFVYEGADNLFRSLSIHFSREPNKTDGTTAQFRLDLQPKETKELIITFAIHQSADPVHLLPEKREKSDLNGIKSYFKHASEEWLKGETQVVSDSLLLNQVIDRSIRDLRTLQNKMDHQEFFAAGVPWFVALFGRDSIITALQTLAYDPEIAAETLRLLAEYQAHESDPWRDAEPGKILHELRVGELAQLGEIPQTPYYGTVDATPLFLILVARHAAWTGSLDLFNELRDNIEEAIQWMDQSGDANGDGYIEYQSESEKGLVNQGWKDSGNAIVNMDGSLAEPPIALVEVQGYAYQAKLGLADLFERAGDSRRAAELRKQAGELRTRFNQDYWMEDQGIYAMALQAGGEQVAAVSSNPGHALWTGIADKNKAMRTVRRLMAEDMFSGWGIRTLSTRNPSFNPVGYHLGTVWPHDNAILAAGFCNYGANEEACQIFTGIIEAAMQFDAYRLPELFAGFTKAEYSVPVHYPIACHPQAWAAGSVPYLMSSFLGLAPEAFDRRLRIIQPALPDFVDQVRVYGLRVGEATADLNFERISKGEVAVKVLKVDGELDVVMEAGGEKT